MAAFRPFLQGVVVASASATAASLFAQNKRATVAQASEALHPPSLPWGFQSFFKSYDMAAYVSFSQLQINFSCEDRFF